MLSPKDSTEPSTPSTQDSKPESTPATKQSSETPKESETHQVQVALVIFVEITDDDQSELQHAWEATDIAKKYFKSEYPDTRVSRSASSMFKIEEEEWQEQQQQSAM